MKKGSVWRPLAILVALSLALLAAGAVLVVTNTMSTLLWGVSWLITAVQLVWPLCRLLLLGYLYLLAVKALKIYIGEHGASGEAPPPETGDPPNS